MREKILPSISGILRVSYIPECSDNQGLRRTSYRSAPRIDAYSWFFTSFLSMSPYGRTNLGPSSPVNEFPGISIQAYPIKVTQCVISRIIFGCYEVNS